LFDNSGTSLTLQNGRTKMEAGIFLFNNGIFASLRPAGLAPGNPNLKIAPLYIPKACTEKWEHEELNLISTSHHQHLLGKHMSLTVIRDGKYHGLIRRERLYDFNHQAWSGGQVTKLKRGDEILFDCTFNTQDQKEVTQFGDYTEMEMCLAFTLYYPKLTQHGQGSATYSYMDGLALGQKGKHYTLNAHCPDSHPKLGKFAVVDPPKVSETCSAQGSLASTDANTATAEAQKAREDGKKAITTKPKPKPSTTPGSSADKTSRCWTGGAFLVGLLRMMWL